MSARNVVTHNMKVINFRQQAVIFQKSSMYRTRNLSRFPALAAVILSCINRRQMPDGISSISL